MLMSRQGARPGDQMLRDKSHAQVGRRGLLRHPVYQQLPVVQDWKHQGPVGPFPVVGWTRRERGAGTRQVAVAGEPRARSHRLLHHLGCGHHKGDCVETGSGTGRGLAHHVLGSGGVSAVPQPGQDLGEIIALDET